MGRSPSLKGQRVVMLHGSSLMAQGLEALLRDLPGIHVTAVDLGEPNAWERLRTAKPDAVLVESAGLEQANWHGLWRLLEEYQDLSVILVHSSEDALSIYRKHLVPINDCDDLVSAIVGSVAHS